jgi:hypothetical protein
MRTLRKALRRVVESAVFPGSILMGKRATIGCHVLQTGIVHLIRHGLAFVSWKDRKAMLPELSDRSGRSGLR